VVIVALYDRPATIDTMYFMHKGADDDREA
jgi:hypothetical protein